MEQNDNLYIGTSGWSYRWPDVLYPEGMKSAERLAYYATRFNTTELNSSFYHFTMAKTIAKWLAETPGSFRFAAKMHQEVTHKRRLVDVEEPLEKFMSRFLAMEGRLGPVLIQLPGSLHFDFGVAADFFGMLRTRYPDPVFALEVRHASWFTEEAQNLLREHAITWVILSAGKRFPSLETTTTDTVYLRLHGDEKLYASAYTDEQLERYALMVHDWLLDGREVWVFFNNTIVGNAVLNAERLRELVAAL
ncbi:DUF72 domain-containing protein [Pontibacter sp. E15-1]|uniref:DUF72 domain-containing protein n=1 Tax=Pontibacter sp. E15-1 TaxID=2919918 RepID=UPI001F4F18E5|nr:DUF72 domain-containing protein [Pontibacter sp. E15-1]MCJ8164456.1 DUF72 domain-containing protein [Pontibacter sp. E15-1]